MFCVTMDSLGFLWAGWECMSASIVGLLQMDVEPILARKTVLQTLWFRWSGFQLVAHEGQLFAVRRPGWNINGSLPAKQFSQDRDFSVRLRYQSQRHILVRR